MSDAEKPQSTVGRADEYDPELEVRDDAIIGRALKWSLVIILVVAVIVTASLLLRGTEAAPEAVIAKDIGPLRDLQPTQTNLPAIPFRDITTESGVDFVHYSSAHGEKLLPETMGGGCAFLDYDNDGDQDLLFVNAMDWPDTPDAQRRSATLALYANDGRGSFTNVTTKAGLDLSMYGMGCAVGDYDNDGNVDIYLTGLNANRLLHNVGGRFVDVTEQARVDGGSRWSTSAGFFDMDNDGDLDLFVCNYVKWSKAIDFELNFTLNGVDRAYGPPTNYTGAQPQLFRNDGEAGFTDVSEQAGLHITNPATGVPVGKGLACVFSDFDRDGFLDIMVANDTVQNFLYHNNGDGTFDEIGSASGVAYDSMGKATGAMGIDAASVRRDDAIAIGIGNFSNEMTSLYVSQNQPLLFADQSMSEGIGSPSRQKLTFGLFFFDADLDGRLDLLQTNGHLEDEINDIQPSQQYRQPAQLFWNCGAESGGCFVLMQDEQVGALSTPIVGRGAAYADIDGDGDLDVLLTQTGGRPMLLRNEQSLGHHWLRVKLVGRRCNRDAIGARLELDVDGRTIRQQVMPTRSYLTQVELPVTFGLGDAIEVDELRIHWPGGEVQIVHAPEVDRVHVIEQPAAAALRP